MTFSLSTLNQYSTFVDTTSYQKLKNSDWNTKIINRGLDTKPYAALKDLGSFYPSKIEKIKALKAEYENYKIACTPEERTEQINNLNEKIKRLVDKYISTLKEIEFRDLNQYKRQVVL